jgi:hypothetical protein
VYDPDQIRQATHELRNNLHVIEMALLVLEYEDDSHQREELIGALKNELEHTKRNLDRFIRLVQPVDG